jgi:hypothetical protein
MLFKKKNMKKQLAMDEGTAKRLYPSSPKEFKEMLEESFGKDFFTQKISDRVKNYDDILEIHGVRKLADEVKVEGFDDAENKLVQNLIKKIRICRAYRDGRPIPKRGEKRYYPWYDVSSGFDFSDAGCVDADADAGSASRLCFLTKEDAEDYNKKFGQSIEKDIIDVN